MTVSSRESTYLDTVLTGPVEFLRTLPGVLSILLLGSGARGELSIAEWRGSPLWFSDLEFMVVTTRRMPGDKQQMARQHLATLAAHIDPRSPLFHIDVTFRERSRLATLPPTIFRFELKRNAVVVAGDDVRSLVPDVKLTDLDMRNTNRILANRLWAILLHVPRAFVVRQPQAELQRLTLAVVCARNALDISTVLLPHAGVLLPTYSERVDYIEAHAPDLPFLAAVGEDLPRFLRLCSDIRQSPLAYDELLRRTTGVNYQGPDESLLQLYSRTIEHLAASLAYVGYRFDERPVSRGEVVNLARLLAQIAWQRGPRAAARWLRTPRKRHLASGLLAMHHSLLAHLLGDDDTAASSLARANHHLAVLRLTSAHRVAPTGSRAGRTSSFADRWLLARRAWAYTWSELIQLGAPAFQQRYAALLSGE